LPCSASCIAAAPTIGLVIDAIQQTVSRFIAGPSPSTRSPKDVSKNVPSRVVAAATTPGTSPETTALRSGASALPRSAVASVRAAVAQPATAPVASAAAPDLMNALRSICIVFSLCAVIARVAAQSCADAFPARNAYRTDRSLTPVLVARSVA
jgi:hypothetical protein